MKFSKRKDRSGRWYYSFVFWDAEQKKNVRIPKSQIPFGLDSDEKANDFIKSFEAKRNSISYRIEKKLDYRVKYFQFKELLEPFAEYMKKRSPVDWRSNVRELEYAVFDFFLNKNDCNNPNDWHLHYSDFLNWLESDYVGLKSKRKISYSAKNGVISALNNFLSFLIEKRKISAATPKCKRFQQDLIKRRNISDVLSPEEIEDLYPVLTVIDKDIADFFRIVTNSGTRQAESLGLSIANIHEGEPPSDILKNIFKVYDIKCLGYISFYSQVQNPSKPRDASGNVLRKKLKGRKVLDVSDSRIVPIIDEDVWNLLVDKYNKCIEQYNSKTYGDNYENYLLFDGLRDYHINKALKRAYEKLPQYKRKTAHCFRHTYTTSLSGKVGTDQRVFELVVGHKDAKTTANYNHLYKAISQTIATKANIALGGLKKVQKKD